MRAALVGGGVAATFDVEGRGPHGAGDDAQLAFTRSLRTLAMHEERAPFVLFAEHVVVVAVDARGLVGLGSEHIREDVDDGVDECAAIEFGEGTCPSMVGQIRAARVRVGGDSDHPALWIRDAGRPMVQPDRGADAA